MFEFFLELEGKKDSKVFFLVVRLDSQVLGRVRQLACAHNWWLQQRIRRGVQYVDSADYGRLGKTDYRIQCFPCRRRSDRTRRSAAIRRRKRTQRRRRRAERDQRSITRPTLSRNKRISFVVFVIHRKFMMCPENQHKKRFMNIIYCTHKYFVHRKGWGDRY